jgi:transcriptional regulator with XRE-family HTH domain
MQHETLSSALGSAIRSKRQSLGLSQERFAEIIEVHRTYMGAIERGERNPSLRTLSRIASGLGVPLSQLLREAEDIITSANARPV